MVLDESIDVAFCTRRIQSGVDVALHRNVDPAGCSPVPPGAVDEGQSLDERIWISDGVSARA